MNPIKEPNIITQTYNNFSLRYPYWGFLHKGVDFGTYRRNVECYSIFEGKVTFSDADGGWGNKIQVYNEDLGKYATYGHLDSLLVNKGQFLARGELLGVVGSTGNSTGIHLHLGISSKPNSEWENPMPYIKQLTECEMVIQNITNAQKQKIVDLETGITALAFEVETGFTYVIRNGKKTKLTIDEALVNTLFVGVKKSDLSKIPNN